MKCCDQEMVYQSSSHNGNSPEFHWTCFKCGKCVSQPTEENKEFMGMKVIVNDSMVSDEWHLEIQKPTGKIVLGEGFEENSILKEHIKQQRRQAVQECIEFMGKNYEVGIGQCTYSHALEAAKEFLKTL